MRLYPQLSGPRGSQILRDVLVVVALALFAYFAHLVRVAVMMLTAISEGFTGGAESAQDAWNGMGNSLSGIPLVGDDIQNAFENLADATFGNAADTGEAVTHAVTTAANVLAFVTFAAPAAVLLVLYLPRRIDRATRWTAAERVLSAVAVSPMFAEAVTGHPTSAIESSADTHDTLALPQPGVGAGAAPAGRSGYTDVRRGPTGDVEVRFPPDELLAMRALCHLPLEDLVRYSPRPFEAFEAGDYAPLVAALYAHEGLVPPGWSSRA